ncbi:ribulokinase [Saccharicrinis sp. GN24d3]|uniref:ribulokinase n=1 Tax=Saccharicrinis sp. GN24d3 TaxID=3458416 RepID=UPI004035BF5E
MKKQIFSMGFDYGSAACRVIILNVLTGEVVGEGSCEYPSGTDGVMTDSTNQHLARQYPGDFLYSLETAAKSAVFHANEKGVDLNSIVGIGVDATASTPIPVNQFLTPLAFEERFKGNLNAQAWMWKDHTSFKEAADITAVAAKKHPEFLEMCGGDYSSEWYWAKIWHCLNEDVEVFDASYTWVELSDYVPMVLCGIKDIEQLTRNKCAAGHKCLHSKRWDGIPKEDFWNDLDPRLNRIANTFGTKVESVETIIGTLSSEWAGKIGLPAGIPIAAGSIDAHVGAIGAGVQEGTMVKIIGTSTCDVMVQPLDKNMEYIQGVSGIAEESVLPGSWGIEGGQSAVGDLLNWYITKVLKDNGSLHGTLTEEAQKLQAGESGLLALDWNNGNRNILGDANLSGMIVGQSLLTTQAGVYRALIEATAYGARRILDQIGKYGVSVEKIVACGGITRKNALFMQIYADVLQRPIYISKNLETVALGAAIFGAYAAMKENDGFKSIEEVQDRVCQLEEEYYKPDSKAKLVYNKLYKIFCQLHDAFGVEGESTDLYPVMKELIQIKKDTSKH